MDIYQTLFELIDTRSFTSMWFWIVLAVFWSLMSHFVLGVPFDLVQKAAKQRGTLMQDVETLARINADRLIDIGTTAGLILTAVGAFLLTGLFLLGFIYGVEFCQALFFLGLPFGIVGLLSQRTARLIRRNALVDDALVRRLRRHRFGTQVVGIISIFITAFWGIFQAMSTNVLGG